MTTPLKVYVAGSSIEREHRAIPIIRKLRKAGIVITHDWTADIGEVSESSIGDSIRVRYSDDDFNAVRHSHYVLLLCPQAKSYGAWIEFGFACGQSIPVVATGEVARKTIFTSKASHMFDTDEEGADFLIDLHERRMKSIWL
jgi:hypothetical protein